MHEKYTSTSELHNDVVMKNLAGYKKYIRNNLKWIFNSFQSFNIKFKDKAVVTGLEGGAVGTFVW